MRFVTVLLRCVALTVLLRRVAMRFMAVWLQGFSLAVLW